MTITAQNGGRSLNIRRNSEELLGVINADLRESAVFERVSLISKWIDYVNKQKLGKTDLVQSAFNIEVLEQLDFLLSIGLQPNRKNLGMEDLMYMEGTSNSTDAPFDVIYDFNSEESLCFGRVLAIGTGKYNGFFMYMNPIKSNEMYELPTITFGYCDDPTVLLEPFYGNSNDYNAVPEAIKGLEGKSQGNRVSVFLARTFPKGFTWEQF